MRGLDAELEKDRAIALRHLQQCPFHGAMHAAEERQLFRVELGDILDMAFPDQHGVTGHRGIGMQNDGATIIFVDDGAELRQISVRLAEAAMH